MSEDKGYLQKWRAEVGNYRRILTPGISHSPLDEESLNPLHVINNIWQRSLAQLVGYDFADRLPVLIATDGTGRLITTSGGVPSIPPSIGAFPVAVVSGMVAGNVPGRAYVLLLNVGPVDVTIGTAATVVAGAGLILRPGQSETLFDWVTPLFAIVAGGAGLLAVVER